jgi:hypothetical protein
MYSISTTHHISKYPHAATHKRVADVQLNISFLIHCRKKVKSDNYYYSANTFILFVFQNIRACAMWYYILVKEYKLEIFSNKALRIILKLKGTVVRYYDGKSQLKACLMFLQHLIGIKYFRVDFKPILHNSFPPTDAQFRLFSLLLNHQLPRIC